VTAANPNTIVVLQTGSAVAMPWLDQTAAVVEAWYSGAQGGEAIASVLFGDTNPSGRLPITFPASVDDLPRPKLDGADVIEPDFQGRSGVGLKLEANYDIEGSDVGYRWNARESKKALFPFGYGLSYTSFTHSSLNVTAGKTITATFTVKNSGARTGADVPQLYLVSVNGQKKLRLAAFDRVELVPGASKKITVTVEPRILAEWESGKWQITAGAYGFALGTSAETLGPVQIVKINARSW
jgi:beta-glucosidase